MEIDGYVVNPEESLVVILKCYSCGGKVDKGKPDRGHESCVTPRGLPLSVEILNYESCEMLSG